jgi:cell division septal protein FtsQ
MEYAEEESPRTGRFWLALILMVIICAFAVYHSALFRLGTLQVRGNSLLTEAQVAETAGVSPGDPRWEHSASVVKARLLAEPWIKSAEVSWLWNRLTVVIVEREPVALLRQYEASYLMVDEEATVLEQIGLRTARGVPVIAAAISQGALRGERLQTPGLHEALALLGHMAKPLREQVSEVNIQGDRSLTLFMVGGATVKWGKLTAAKEELALEQKLTLFGDYWRTVAGKRVSSCQIDMRIDGRVIPSGCQ